MARAHGFRIYVVQAFVGQMKGREAEDVSVGSATYDRILRLLGEVVDASTQHFAPRPVEPGEPERPIGSMTVNTPVLVRDDLVHLEVEMGEQGSHRRATRQGSRALDIGEWSPEAAHYVTLLFPTSPSDRFVIVAHTIRRRDPVYRFISLLQRQDLADNKIAAALLEEERVRAREAGESVPARRREPRLLLDERQATDTNYIDQIIETSKTATAKFTATVPNSRGGESKIVQRSLDVRLLDEKGKDAARTASRRWFTRQRRGEATTQAAGVSELAGLLSEEGLMVDGESEVYDKAAVSVKSDMSETTTIGVDTMRDVFTYPVSDGAPPVAFYYGKVAPRLDIVVSEEKIEVGNVSPEEVERCLDALTLAP